MCLFLSFRRSTVVVSKLESALYHPPFNISRRDGRLYFPLECVMSFSLLAPARTLYSLTKRWSGLSLLLLYINCTGYVWVESEWAREEEEEEEEGDFFFFFFFPDTYFTFSNSFTHFPCPCYLIKGGGWLPGSGSLAETFFPFFFWYFLFSVSAAVGSSVFPSAQPRASAWDHVQTSL